MRRTRDADPSSPALREASLRAEPTGLRNDRGQGPDGHRCASGTVQDGVLALQFGAYGIRVYTIDVGDPTGGQVDFDLWDIVESR
ncbi:MAG: hypothetical protein E6I52_09665 [Chloroflexi bacterium]|nr:MAG: hypothetical protein E6I52_09665 [Chloroflexota bacterium]